MNLLLLQYNRPDHASGMANSVQLGIFEYVLYPLAIIAIIFFLLVFLLVKKELMNRWSTLILGLSYSTKEFYERLEKTLSEQGLEGLDMHLKKINIGAIGMGQRYYFVVRWKEFQYDICAAPFADSFFVSYWALQQPNRFAYALSKIPLVGTGLSSLLFPITYYKVDTSSMFHTLIHQCVTDTVDLLLKENNQPALTENKKSPVMRDIFGR